MLNFRIFLLSLTLVFTFGACKKSMVGISEPCQANVADSSSKHPKAAIFQAILDKYKKRGLPGVAILIEDENGVWMGSAGKADIAENVDFKPCTVSKVASITKMMFAAAIMQLREQGKVNLDDKISKWLDADIIKNVKNAENATLKDLMQHSTGIYDVITDSDFYLAVLNNPNKKWTGEELIKFVYNKPTIFDYVPNATQGGYSNTNTLLMSMCIEKITGRPHNEWMHELVIDKVGMSNTYYHHHDALPAFTAQGYYDLYNNGTIVNVSNLVTGSGNGYGGIYSNVIDLHKFMKALFINKTLVSQQSLDLMQTFISDDERGDLGIGLLRQYKHLNLAHLGVGHSGRDLGYSGDAHYFPTRNNRIFINLVNYGTNGNTPLRQVFYDMRDEFATEMNR
ncbi:MAG TPA: serine hydrolase domain-containing protein [Bacteroidia bacterium]